MSISDFFESSYTMDNTTHLVAFLLLLARIGDVGSTYLATPKLKLEANPVVRRFKWLFALCTLFVAVAPYYSLPFGLAFLIASLLVCASNFSRIWLMRTMGEDDYHLLIIRMAFKAHLPSTIVFMLMPGLCMAMIGFLLLYFYPDPNSDWGYHFGFGFFVYAIAICFYGLLAFFRFRKEGRALMENQLATEISN